MTVEIWPSLQTALGVSTDGWVVRAVFMGLLALTGFFLQRTLTLLDTVTDKVSDHGERLAVAETEIKNLKDDE